MMKRSEYDDIDLDEEEESNNNNRSRKKNQRKIFTVWEIDTVKEDTPKYPAFESVGNPIPALRYASKMTRLSKRHKYVVSPRPHAAAFKAAGIIN